MRDLKARVLEHFQNNFQLSVPCLLGRTGLSYSMLRLVLDELERLGELVRAPAIFGTHVYQLPPLELPPDLLDEPFIPSCLLRAA